MRYQDGTNAPSSTFKQVELTEIFFSVIVINVFKREGKHILIILRVLAGFYVLISVITIVASLGIDPNFSILVLPVLTVWALINPTLNSRWFLLAGLLTESALRFFGALGLNTLRAFVGYPEFQLPTILGFTYYAAFIFLAASGLVLKAKAQFAEQEMRSYGSMLLAILLGILVAVLPWLEVNTSFRAGSGVLGYKPYVTDAFFSPDGKVVSVTNFSVHTYDIATARKEKFTPSAGINSATYSADGKTLIFGTYTPRDQNQGKFGVYIWDLAAASRPGRYLTMSPVENENDHYPYPVEKVIARPNSQEIAVITGRMKDIIEIWDIHADKRLQRFDLNEVSVSLTGKPTYALAIAFDPSGQYLVAGGMNGDLFLFDLAKHTVKTFSSGHAGEIYDCAFSPDGQTLAVAFNQKVDPKKHKAGSHKGYVELWDFAKLELAKRMTWESDSRCRSIALSPDSRYVLSAGDGNVVRIWRINDGEQLVVLKDHPYSIIYAVAISPAGDYVIASGGEYTKIWAFPYDSKR